MNHQNNDWQQRTELLLGSDKLLILQRAHVLIAGLGGVGSAAAEMLCRAGIGQLTLADADTYQPGNRNRQIAAFISTEGQKKTEVMAQRLKDINPEIKLELIDHYLKDETTISLLSKKYDYVVDAIDTLSPKVYLIYHAVQSGQKLVSAMGAGAKLDPSRISIADISETNTCPFAYDIRKRLRKLGIHNGFLAVYSSEPIIKSAIIRQNNEQNKKSNTGTISYMPVIFGCYCASAVIRKLIR